MNKIIPYLKSATALTGYKLNVEFDDGITGIIDLNKWIGKIAFAYWNDYKNFQFFHITEDKKIEWNEQIDMDPDSFYLELINKSFSEYTSDLQFLGYPH
jgi:hypothetical protein